MPASAAGKKIHSHATSRLGVAGPPPSAFEFLWAGKIPSLDGLRALSILLVLLCHLRLTQGLSLPPVLAEALRWGARGVDMFFVISGFLITVVLLREKRRTGRLSLRNFYVRRALRIFPAYYAYLLALAAVSSLGFVSIATRDWVAALTYTTNFLVNRNWETGHLWSLAVEEHFYFVWPFLLIKLGDRKAFRVAGLYILIAPMLRVVLRIVFRGNLDIDDCTFTRADSIAVGCCVALAVQLGDTFLSGFLSSVKQQGIAAVTLLTAIIALNMAPKNSIFIWGATLFEGPLTAAFFATVMWMAITNPRNSFSWLSARPLVFLGTLSYSLYLWQQPFLNHHNQVDAFARWPLNIGLVFLFATASHFLIESPFLRLKDRLDYETPAQKRTKGLD